MGTTGHPKDAFFTKYDPYAKPEPRMNNDDFVAALDRAKMAERERCAKIADDLATGQAIDVAGHTLPLGSMAMNPVEAQRTTAIAIATTIRAANGHG